MGKTMRVRRLARANDFSVLNPTIWANEAITQLLPNMVAARLINRTLSSTPRLFGDQVNVLVPATFSFYRKGALSEDVSIQDASVSRVQVPLNQWPQVSFLIPDGEENRPMQDLIEMLLTPAVQALAQGVDQIVTNQIHRFYDAGTGHLGGLTDSTFKDYILENREALNRSKVPLENRVMLLSPGSETAGLTNDNIMTADKVGDGGDALANADLGRKYGYNFFMSQTVPEITAGQDTIDAVTSTTYAIGSTTIAHGTATGGTFAAGMWVSIEGDDRPRHIASVTTGNTMTLSTAIESAVGSSKSITAITPGAVQHSAGYDGPGALSSQPGHAKDICVDGFTTAAPQVGQMVSFGTQAHVYGIIAVAATGNSGEYNIKLDRPLAAALTNGLAVNLGPVGKYNMGFLAGAFAMLTAPLAAPRVGALSRVVTDPKNKLAIRVTITYDAVKQGHLVTLDFLMGVAPVNSALAAPMFG